METRLVLVNEGITNKETALFFATMFCHEAQPTVEHNAETDLIELLYDDATPLLIEQVIETFEYSDVAFSFYTEEVD